MKRIFFLGILSTLIVGVFAVAELRESKTSDDFSSENRTKFLESPEWFVIDGLVQNPLNLTYFELWDYPQVSEVTTLQYVGSGQGSISVTYNWTGVPLFYLLSMANVMPGGYREVVFNANDGFSSSILLETAMHPTTILALEANGTDLEQKGGFGGGYRVALPCRWGYKWVRSIGQISVVDYDYKGTYEQDGYSDQAIRPNCSMPSTDPPIQIFNATKTEEHTVEVLSNSSIISFSFESNRTLTFNVEGPEGTMGYFYVKFPTSLLSGPYAVSVDGSSVRHSQTYVDGAVYLCFDYSHSVHTIEIEGPLSFGNGVLGGKRVKRGLD